MQLHSLLIVKDSISCSFEKEIIPSKLHDESCLKLKLVENLFFALVHSSSPNIYPNFLIFNIYAGKNDPISLGSAVPDTYPLTSTRKMVFFPSGSSISGESKVT